MLSGMSRLAGLLSDLEHLLHNFSQHSGMSVRKQD